MAIAALGDGAARRLPDDQLLAANRLEIRRDAGGVISIRARRHLISTGGSHRGCPA
jgi:hypothetical protein